jgi:hypothetical protein
MMQQVQMQHVIKTQKKVIYFNKKQVLEDFNNRRVWRWNCSLTTDLVMTVVVDYASKPGTCQYDLMVRGLPFRKWAKLGAQQAPVPSRYSQPTQRALPRAPMNKQVWGAQGMSAPQRSPPPPAQKKTQSWGAQRSAPAAQPQPQAAPEVSLIDWGAEEETIKPVEASPLNIFDPLAGAAPAADGDSTEYSEYEYVENEDGGVLALNSDLASLSWGNEAEQADDDDAGGLSVDSGEVSGFGFISDDAPAEELQAPAEECLVPTDAWDAGSSLIDLNLSPKVAGGAAGAMAFNGAGAGAGSGFNFIENSSTGVSDAAKNKNKPSAFYDPFAGI